MRQRSVTRREKSAPGPVCETMRDFFGALAVFAAVFVFAMVNARAAHPQDAAAPDRSPASIIKSGEQAMPHRGRLLVRPTGPTAESPPATTSITPLGSSWDINITGPIVRTAITEVFHNRGDDPVDGIYVRTLPDGTAVDRLNLDFGGRTIVGSVKPLTGAAPDAHKAAQTQGLAALVGTDNQNRFTGSVENIAAGDRVSVRIEYQQTLQWREEGYRLHVPLPRRGKRYDDKIRISLNAGFPLGAIHSDTHRLTVDPAGNGKALLVVHEPKGDSRDFLELSWRPKPVSQPTARLMAQTGPGGDYLVAMITPPAKQDAGTAPARDVIFVVDTSGSMAGSSIHQVRDSLERAIARLRPEDRFNIIAFEATHEALFETPVDADADNKAIARHFLARLTASGGTELVRPLSTALHDPTPEATQRIRQIVLITDGTIRNGQQLLSEIAVKRGRSRLFFIGLGTVPSDRLLHHAAKVGRGTHLHIASIDGLGVKLDRFLTGLERPVLTDVAIAWPKGTRAVSSLDPLPDLYGEAPLVASIRLDKRTDKAVAISGTVDGKPWRAEATLVRVDDNSGVAQLWAQHRIESLESHAQFTSSVTSDISAKIKKVALQHGLVGHRTRLAAVEPVRTAARTDAAARRSQPAGEPTAADHIASATTTSQTVKTDGKVQTHSPQAQNTPVIAQTTGTMPDASNTAKAEERPAARNWDAFPGRLATVGLMGLIFAAMSALTLGLWRHLGRSYARPRRRVARDIQPT